MAQRAGQNGRPNSLLTHTLKDQVNEPKPVFPALAQIAEQNGPICQLTLTLEPLVDEPKPVPPGPHGQTK